MNKHLDLQKLRAFDAAARHLSFTRASSEMNISQSAVSQQIRSLEDSLGVSLFIRKTRALALTEDGTQLAAVARDIIERAAHAVVQLQDSAPHGLLTISCLPAFSTFWLAPRLSEFLCLYPRLSVKLLSASDVVDFRSTDADVAIRWGRGAWPHAVSWELFRKSYVPVCSPQFAEARGLNEVERLLDVPFLSDADEASALWSRWFEATGHGNAIVRAKLFFETTADLISAAEASAGLALVRLGLVRNAIERGHLVRPVSNALPSENGYHIVYAAAREQDPRIMAFRDWILKSTSKSRTKNDC